MTTDADIRAALAHKVVHMLGLSDKPERDSFKVAKYLTEHGYRVVPIHPKVDAVLGVPAFKTLAEANAAEPVRLVDVFRGGDALPGIVDELEGLPNLEAVWLQLGVRNAEAEARLKSMDVTLVVDHCMKIEHEARNAG